MRTGEIKEYYEELATRYDQDRFGNTYGQYVDQQEREILTKYLTGVDRGKIVDIACGTGRFMNFCGTGLDLSEQMIAQAQQKYPDRTFLVANALNIPIVQTSFEAAICFHLIMHLQANDLAKVLSEMGRLVVTNGHFIFDVPTQERRTLLRHQQANWHGANAFTHKVVLDALADDWALEAFYGIAMLPIHRLPNALRPALVGVDTFLCRTPLKKYASYRVYIVRKR